MQKFSRPKHHRRNLFRDLATKLIIHEKIETTDAKAKAIRPIIEKIVTRAKEDSVANRRQTSKFVRHEFDVELTQTAVQKLYNELAPKFKTRNGGYTRIIKTGFRKGDGAPTSIIEFVE